MSKSSMRRFLSPVVDLREGETATAVLMFIYSFLVMAAYNNIRPSATSKFIDRQARRIFGFIGGDRALEA